MPYVFLDFEASSLSKQSYPIEVGWVHEDGSGEAHLIRPATGWTDWDASAEAIHHIARPMLDAEGEPHDLVWAKMQPLFATNVVVASAPSWDGHWLSMLLRAAGQPRHLHRLQDTEIAFLDAVRKRTTNESEGQDMIAAARAKFDSQPAGHRAEADARREWSIWRTIVEGS